MDNSLEKQLFELREAAEIMHDKFRRSMIRTIIIYGVLAVFVLVYTCILYHEIATAVTPPNVAELLSVKVQERLPGMRDELRSQMPEMAKRLAVHTADAAQALIPHAGLYAKSIIDENTDHLLKDLKDRHMPVIRQTMDEAVSETLAHQKELKDPSLGKAISAAAREKIDAELDKILNREFFIAIDDLQKRLHELKSMPPEQMTRQQYSERMFLVYWLLLVDKNQNAPEKTPVASFAEIIQNAVGQMK